MQCQIHSQGNQARSLGKCLCPFSVSHCEHIDDDPFNSRLRPMFCPATDKSHGLYHGMTGNPMFSMIPVQTKMIQAMQIKVTFQNSVPLDIQPSLHCHVDGSFKSPWVKGIERCWSIVQSKCCLKKEGPFRKNAILQHNTDHYCYHYLELVDEDKKDARQPLLNDISNLQ